jgi:hypothetical protein
MFRSIDFWKLQNSDEIDYIYKSLKSDLLKYNNSFFHYPNEKVQTLLTDSTAKDSEEDYYQFILSWENFNNHKHILNHFFKSNKLNYPAIFESNNRICIDEITINYSSILNEINVLKINKKPIPYIYTQIITKLIKNIIQTKYLSANEKFLYLNVNFQKNNIELQLLNVEFQKEYIKNFKLNKFLLRYQRIYPSEFKEIKAWLMVSSNWKDIFLSSTFKQWTSCMNMINTYSDILVKYSNENYVRSGRPYRIFSFKFK